MTAFETSPPTQVAGPTHSLAWAVFTPGGTGLQTLTEAHGIRSITRVSLGRWSVQLAEKGQVVRAWCAVRDSDSTTYRTVNVMNYQTPQLLLQGRARAWGPSVGLMAFSEDFDEITVFALVRTGA